MKKLLKRFYNGSLSTFCALFVWEMLEELLEETIATGITKVVSFAVSSLMVITLTQGTKIIIKNTVKTLTYREGQDKMNKVKQFFTWIYANKKSLLGVGASAVGVMSGSGIIDVSLLPSLTAFGLNLTPFIFYSLIAVLSIFGVCGKGFEKIDEFFNRIKALKDNKEEAKLEKEAKKELIAEKKQEKLTNEEKEKKEAKEQAEKLKAEEKEKAEAEHRAKIEAIKAKLKADETSNG